METTVGVASRFGMGLPRRQSSAAASPLMLRPRNDVKFKCCPATASSEKRNYSRNSSQPQKRCLRCNTIYQDKDNSPNACSFHGHTTGEKGLFALAPPHQGIDGEWSDRSGVIVYKWNEKNNRPNTGIINWKRRWSCCQEYDENAPPCQHGWKRDLVQLLGPHGKPFALLKGDVSQQALMVGERIQDPTPVLCKEICLKM